MREQREVAYNCRMRKYFISGCVVQCRLGAMVASVVGLSTVLFALNVGPVGAAQVARPVPPKDFQFGTRGASLAIAGGRTVRIPITIRRGKGFTSKVTFTIVNPFQGVEVSKEDVTVSGMTLVVAAQRDVTFQQGFIVITAKGGRKSRSLSVMASFRPEDPVDVAPDVAPEVDSDGIGAGVPPTSVVRNAAAGFGVVATITSSSTAVRGGDTLAFKVTIQRDATVIGPIKLSVTNSPVGLGTFFANEVIEGDEGALFLRASESAAPGQYSLSLQASTDKQSVTIQVPVTVS